MSDWADHALSKLKKQQEDQRVKDSKFLERQRLKNVHGERLWDEVRSAVKENCTHFNKKAEKEILLFEVTQNTVLSIRAKLDSGARILTAAFNQHTGILSWECGSDRGAWELAVMDDGSVQFGSGSTTSTPPSIANKMLDALLFG